VSVIIRPLSVEILMPGNFRYQIRRGKSGHTAYISLLFILLLINGTGLVMLLLNNSHFTKAALSQ